MPESVSEESDELDDEDSDEEFEEFEESDDELPLEDSLSPSSPLQRKR